jgi:hypothetical protein
MTAPAPLPLASSAPDEGPGSVWPVALLSGGLSAALLSAGVWVGLEASGAQPRFGFADWVAEHALLGLLAGLLVTGLLRLGRPLDPRLACARERRAAALRLGVLGSLAVLCVLAASSRALFDRPFFVLTGLLAGAAAATLCLRLWLGSLRRARELPRLDPLKVAVLLALVLAPLQDGGAAASLRGAWQVMLGE